ncbi:hypothetical protein [Methanoregula sp.]|uniref:hypothetical protein n=1 Tax=Methanoregula sp. TaxID=2052170 RepID=UPI003569D800
MAGIPLPIASDPQLMAYLRPVLQNARAEELAWSLAWTVAMDDDGKMVVDLRGLPVASAPGCCTAPSRGNRSLRWTGETRKNILGRMRMMNGVEGRVVGGV